MRNSISLPREPSLREASALLADVERELAASGAGVERVGTSALRFTVPAPWRRPSPGALAGVSTGTVGLIAGGGGPWRIRYTLHFRRLYVAAAVVTAIVAAVAWRLPRTTLVVAVLACWLVVFGVPWAIAGRRAHRLVLGAARRVGERRTRPRTPAAP
jgi:hypothetical protein